MSIAPTSLDRIEHVTEHLVKAVAEITSALHMAIEVPEMAAQLGDLFDLHQLAVDCRYFYCKENIIETEEGDQQCTQ